MKKEVRSMNFAILQLLVKEKIYAWLKKDNMEVKLERYRKQGAKIGGGVRAFSPISSAEPYLISIGNNTTISTNVKFITHDNAAIKIFDIGTDLVGGINIGNNCFIGANSILLPGVNIGNNVIVGAGSCVTKSFENEGVIIAGNPAKIIGTVEKYHEKYKNNVFDFSGENRKYKKQMIQENPEKLINKH